MDLCLMNNMIATPLLLALVQMILGGTNIVKQTENNRDVKTAAISITELLTFNAVKRSRKVTSETLNILFLDICVMPSFGSANYIANK